MDIKKPYNRQKKPEDIEEYKQWLKDVHDIEISTKTKTYYNTVTNSIKTHFEKSNLWLQLTENLNRYDQEYLLDKGYHLLTVSNTKLQIKPFDSIIEKTFRKNILYNKNWPELPRPNAQWITPDNWYTLINDTVRTLFVVKYLDGVSFLINKIKSLCKENETECKSVLEARTEGYYAAHLYIKKEFEVPGELWDPKKINAKIEIQITTQLQDVIRKLLHKHYETRRLQTKKPNVMWQWDYRSDEFSTNYLGHILHYIEGMIVEIREKQKEENNGHDR